MQPSGPSESTSAPGTVPSSPQLVLPRPDCEQAIKRQPPCPIAQRSAPLERGKTRLASAFFAYFVLGWGDGVTGTLLPHFKSDLHLSFVLSSLFWVASASGYALGTIVVEHVTRIIGRTRFSTQKLPNVVAFPLRFSTGTEKESTIVGFSRSRSRFYTMVSASLLHAVFFILMGCKLGFLSMMIAYVISAFARSFISATLNVYVPSVSKGGLGFLYGSTSLGGFVAPLVCQSIIATGIRWANFYFGSLVLSAINTSFIIYAFWPTQDELRGDAELAWTLYNSASTRLDSASSVAATTVQSPTSSTAPILRATAKDVLGPRSYMAAVKNLQMWADAVFSCIYSGSESATQGFIVVYLLGTRHANPNTAGYVTSGFWGGMALSRFAWGYLGPIVSFRQRKWIVQACICKLRVVEPRRNYTENPLSVIAFVMHLLILLVPSFVENAVSTAVIGTVYGPIFPSNLAVARDLLPTEVHLVSLAIIAACGSIGAALFPFIAGLLTTNVGAYTLPYITIAQTVAMFCIWFFFPSRLPTSQN
ncbi:MFS general substrate transporter [Lenzites betulinus]|nr:MFS general substrate transporter [Lenzites betulinus]